MTIKDGFKLGIGIIAAYFVIDCLKTVAFLIMMGMGMGR